MTRMLILIGMVVILAACDPNAPSGTATDDQPGSREDRGGSSY